MVKIELSNMKFSLYLFHIAGFYVQKPRSAENRQTACSLLERKMIHKYLV